MAAVEVTITGTLYDKLNRTTQQVVLIGEASLTGLGIGGGPIIPPGQPPGQQPPGVPTFPIALPPGSWGPGGPPGPGYPPSVEHPIVLPPDQVPPGMKPPEPPQPGDPTTPVPPPPGSAGWPVSSIVPPPYIVVQYPGIGPVVVAPPAPAS